MMKTHMSRRRFMGELSAIGAIAAVSPGMISGKEAHQAIVKPPRLQKGDWVGLIAPASGVLDPKTIREGRENLESLGFRVKLGQHLQKRYGYLAGSDEERIEDLHHIFEDKDVKAVMALRGGYGSIRILSKIDYDLIRRHPKILIGYSDITALTLAIHQMTGLVTFHGPVAISSFSDYTQEYFTKALSIPEAMGEIQHPRPESELHPGSDFNTICGGMALGRLIGGNLTLLTSLIGTPFDVDTRDRILFLEEVGEEPYAIDRMLTQLSLAGKFEAAAGIVIDRCSQCGIREYKPAFPNSLGVEEVFIDRLKHLRIPVLFGFSLGHVANKPTLPLGVRATLNADERKLVIEEAAVI